MFKHIYLSRLKAQVRSPEAMFWIIIFPYILCVIFYVILKPMGNMDLPPLKLALVQDENLSTHEGVIDFLEAFSPDQSDKLSISYALMDEEKALATLNAYDIDGVFQVEEDGKLALSINRSRLEESILRSLTDSYNQIGMTTAELISENPQLAEKILKRASAPSENLFINETYSTGTNMTDTYFFTIIAMFVLYAMSFTIDNLVNLNADQSNNGARFTVSPASKSVGLLASIAVCLTIQMINNVLMIFVLDKLVDVKLLHLGPALWVVLLAANLCAIALGSVLATIPKLKYETKFGLCIGLTMLLSFFSGMMSADIRLLLITRLPFLAKLNPAELIVDSLYSGSFFGDMSRMWQNAGLLLAIAILAFLFSSYRMRRSSYVSL